MQRRTERNKANYPQPVTVQAAPTDQVLRTSRVASEKSRNDYNLHIRTHSAAKVREIAAACNTTNGAVVTAMIDFAYERATFTSKHRNEVTCTFNDIGRARE